MQNDLRTATTDQLEVAYFHSGPEDGQPVILMHGFPYDPHAYDEVADRLSDASMRVIVPYMRGYGPTRFLAPSILRSGEQAAFGNDLIQLMDVLELQDPILVGYDWGGRAACIVSAIWPDRVRALVSITGYNIFGPAALGPRDAYVEHYSWYQYHLLSQRTQQLLDDNRREFCRYLWSDWSPRWGFDDETFARTASSFDNEDFIDVVLHSYRHRYGEVPGDPFLADLQAKTETLPVIPVPTIVLHGAEDFYPASWSEERERFTGPYERFTIPVAGHNLPQESPGEVVDSVMRIAGQTQYGRDRG